jgi:hypothetical protein
VGRIGAGERAGRLGEIPTRTGRLTGERRRRRFSRTINAEKYTIKTEEKTD